ncbi:hypothetical protein [Vibrio sp. 99-8-1]|uniref:hypothetical protein n=1 Tax=Vibrio sp. 99-8-1 TaxID=2607602 RepID=UPI00149351CF|nr:hypothetical protein [Vibrio sp. 99-8-1]NOI65478.1 hypothetical protein [Vibrio sp. 99-8-1]
MVVDIETLQNAMLQVFEHLKHQGINSLDIDSDFYWNIEKKQRYDPYQMPNDIDLGQLSDSWDEIQKIASGEREPIGYALIWIASLYQYIGETNPS